MVKRKPFIPQQREGRSKIRLPFRHLLDPGDPHYYEISVHLEKMRRAGVEIDQATADNATKLIRWEREQPRIREEARMAAVQEQLDKYVPLATDWAAYRDAANRWKTSPGIVYYLLRGSLIKIGTTTRPRARFDALMPDAVLAVEPGDPALERIRHDQFGPFRNRDVGREHFDPNPVLINHIRKLREQYGVPDSPHLSLMPQEDAVVRVKELLAQN